MFVELPERHYGPRDSALRVAQDKARRYQKTADKWKALAEVIEKNYAGCDHDKDSPQPCFSFGSDAEFMMWFLMTHVRD